MNMRAVDLNVSGGWSGEQIAEILQCWKGRRIRIIGRDNVIQEGMLVSADSTPSPTVSFWTSGGMNYWPLCDVARIERM